MVIGPLLALVRPPKDDTADGGVAQRPPVGRTVAMIVIGAVEAALTPLMEEVERDHPAIKVFSLPSVDHPQWGRHIDLGVKGPPEAVEPAYQQLRRGLAAQHMELGPELVRS
jgi:molybdopterin-biosynthesis enzyme MoeA-like protein